MGTSNRYECEKCKQSVQASLKETEGMNTKVKAFKCNDCNEVGDCIIAFKNDLHPEYQNVIPSCEECGGKNVIAWDVKCPKCGNAMNDTGFSMMWD